MMSVNPCRQFLLLSLLLSIVVRDAVGFVPSTGLAPMKAAGSRASFLFHDDLNTGRHTDTGSTSLFMSQDGGGGNKGLLTAAGLAVVLALFLAGSILPMIGDMGGGGVAPMANAVATRDQAQQVAVTNEKYRLSRAAIQEKLNTVPVFYALGDNEDMGTNLYISYDDAKEAAGSKVVKATTLDQVEYPLVLRRGRMRMAPPPAEIQKAEDALNDSGKVYTLVPSKHALADAAELKIDLAKNDFPLYVADRLAFANPNGGLQVPLFLEKSDCLTSYTRLRGSNLNLPETPNIRSTTLNDELFSMEKGTRPGMTQLTFYASADDVNRAVEMIGR